MSSTPPPSIPPRQQRQRPGRPAGAKPAAAPQPPAEAAPRRSVKGTNPASQPASQPATPSQTPPPVQPPSYAPRKVRGNAEPVRQQLPTGPRQPGAQQPGAHQPGVHQTMLQPQTYQPVGSSSHPQVYPTRPDRDNSGPGGGTRPPSRPRKRRKVWPWALLVVLVLVIGWPLWLLYYTNQNLQHIEALVPGPDSPGVTYLIAGSDQRPDGWNEDGVEGGRSDSIVLIHKATNGQTSMVSLPRDTYVEIPGYGWNKLNAAFSFGGAPLLVETVQIMSGLTIDHFVQIDMNGVAQLVDAVGGVEMCLDMDVNEPHSQLVWEAGCHDVDGNTALALARMRYDDPRGDLGRAERQRDLMSKVAGEALSWGTIFNPAEQLRLSRAGTNTLFVDETMSVFDVAKMMLTFRSAGNLSGTPPLWSTSEMTDVGAVVLLDEDAAPGFFQKMANGELTPTDFETEF